MARALYAAAVRAGRHEVVVYADAAQREGLRSLYPDDVLQDGVALRASARPIGIIVCALGLPHPAPPELATHMKRFDLDTGALANLIAEAGTGSHVVLVSTVIALAPPRDRAYYAAFKNLAESVLAASLRKTTGAMLSVVYPGRLTERRGRFGTSGVFATPYAELAEKLLSVVGAQVPVSRVIGLDARLWLLVRSIGLFKSVLFSNLGSPSLIARDGSPRA